MRTAAIELADDVQQRGIDTNDVDALFVTSLMSASDLRALLPVGLRGAPMVLYMHENQAAYPAGEGGDDPRDVHFLLTNITSCAAADRVLWNSAWNRRSFLEGAANLFAHSRDRTLRDVLPATDAKSEVVWPPVEVLLPASGEIGGEGTGSLNDTKKSNEVRTSPRPNPVPRGEGAEGTLHNPTRVVWPHRWEYDKGPEELLEIARRYTRSHNLRWVILGERYQRVPAALETFANEFRDSIEHMGYVESRDAYWQWLSRADWVLSTARHEFFGIAVVEALMMGALPWLPERLSYPELLPSEARGLSPMNPPGDPESVRNAIHAHLQPALAHNAVQRIDGMIEQACVRA